MQADAAPTVGDPPRDPRRARRRRRRRAPPPQQRRGAEPHPPPRDAAHREDPRPRARPPTQRPPRQRLLAERHRRLGTHRRHAPANGEGAPPCDCCVLHTALPPRDGAPPAAPQVGILPPRGHREGDLEVEPAQCDARHHEVRRCGGVGRARPPLQRRAEQTELALSAEAPQCERSRRVAVEGEESGVDPAAARPVDKAAGDALKPHRRRRRRTPPPEQRRRAEPHPPPRDAAHRERERAHARPPPKRPTRQRPLAVRTRRLGALRRLKPAKGEGAPPHDGRHQRAILPPRHAPPPAAEHCGVLRPGGHCEGELEAQPAQSDALHHATRRRGGVGRARPPLDSRTQQPELAPSAEAPQ